MTGRKAQDSVPVRWNYEGRQITHGLEGWSTPDQEAARKTLTNWVYDKVAYDQSMAGKDVVESNPEAKINSVLRGKTRPTPGVQQDIRNMDRIMRASKLPEPVEVFRGFHESRGILPKDWQTRDLTGVTWHNVGFTSTSVNRDAAETYAGPPEHGGFAIRLHLPKGMSAISIQDQPGGLDDEGEVILPRNLGFRVIKDNGVQGEYGVRWLDVEPVLK